MAATFSLADSVMALAYVQTAISCIAGILLIYSVHGLVRWSALPLAIAMAGFFLDSDAFAHDTAMMTESLYTSLLIISFALFMRAFSAKQPASHLAGASLCMALVIYTKPAGLYLLVIYVLVLCYLAYRRMPRRTLLAFALPFPIALAALAGSTN